ncbi:helix-turn-helix domain-containing protein [Pontibacter sp. BT310]|uniref:AraC family transcriptional regulator n=1 Tax=Pontibacter populi TaxID=890055 RepID=A0ABS6XDL8_9BACT|nr:MULTISPECIES: helix-turn-helix domain-containing protein [Pontibacter]MBJ6118900.1 helix-turn-helix domain-containing protein [Pontibacter sp. BT310]MBR0571328.1 helix-turn-helix domain-containing protein [Microvirga sp. STS03]MBW3365754.1 AraC family transcriptional regulator [Pontibacter populi]
MHPKRFYKGLYGTNSIEFAKGLINVHPFGEIGKQYQGQVKLHAHNNFLQIFLIQSGTTEFYYGTEKTVLQGPTFIVAPKNIEHGFIHQTDVTGWILNLADNVLEHMLQREADVIFGMDEIHIVKVTPAQPAITAVFETMQKCVEEYNSQMPGRLLMLQHLVGQMLVQLYRIALGRKTAFFDSSNSSKVYFRRFQQLIRAEESYKKHVEDYARDLSISTGHLSRICRDIAGKSPKDILIDHFITKAQLALSDVESSVSDISYTLGFDDPAYFARIFKKKTGQTPIEFRKKIGVNNS